MVVFAICCASSSIIKDSTLVPQLLSTPFMQSVSPLTLWHQSEVLSDFEWSFSIFMDALTMIPMLFLTSAQFFLWLQSSIVFAYWLFELDRMGFLDFHRTFSSVIEAWILVTLLLAHQVRNIFFHCRFDFGRIFVFYFRPAVSFSIEVSTMVPLLFVLQFRRQYCHPNFDFCLHVDPECRHFFSIVLDALNSVAFLFSIYVAMLTLTLVEHSLSLMTLRLRSHCYYPLPSRIPTWNWRFDNGCNAIFNCGHAIPVFIDASASAELLFFFLPFRNLVHH